MYKIIFTYILIVCGAFAQVPQNQTCKGCHPLIYSEFEQSAHKKSTIENDAIHKAIWDIHPDKSKNDYSCQKCHAPQDEEITQNSEAISCVYCHSIASIKENKYHNENVLVNNDKKRPTLFASDTEKKGTKIEYKEKSSFFGMFKSTTGSPYHDIDYSNEGYYNAQSCMGCHANFKNEHDISVCSTDKNSNTSEKNCISCHMPQIAGSATTIAISKTHTYHGFAGVRNSPQMLSKYIEIDISKKENGFNLIIENKAPHKLMLHPLRLAVLKIKLIGQTDTIDLEETQFMRILGHDDKPTMPWMATKILKDTMLETNEKRTLSYNHNLDDIKEIEIVFGYYLVNPKMIEKLNLQDSIEATQFKVLKSKTIIVEKL